MLSSCLCLATPSGECADKCLVVGLSQLHQHVGKKSWTQNRGSEDEMEPAGSCVRSILIPINNDLCWRVMVTALLCLSNLTQVLLLYRLPQNHTGKGILGNVVP